MRSAYLLISHGSRDLRSQAALDRLAHSIRHQLEKRTSPLSSSFGSSSTDRLEFGTSSIQATVTLPKPQPLSIETACLELAPMPLHQSIYQFARQVEEAGLSRIEIFPLFLLPGVHVKEDIPREVGLARQLLGKTVDLKLWAYLGSYPILKQLLKKQLIDLPAEGKILLSHGSRRPGGNYPCEAIAREIGGISAYWSVPPCLTQQVEKLVADGVRSIAILPYFLFPGGITDAIARSVSQLEQRFPQVRFSLGEPLGTLPELGHFIVEEIA